ncbi:putative phage abortive infection protein [Lactococcus lactis]
MKLKKSTNKRLDQQSEESERRISSEQVSNAFYKLLEVFTNIQKQVSIQKIKENINNLYAANSWDFHLKKGYCSNDGKSHQLEMFLDVSNINEDKIRFNSDEENMAIVINMRFEELYADSSQYFKAFHRIVKILNVSLKNNKIDKEEYHSYIGILRANLSSDEMEILLINSLFVKRGIGLGLELIGTDFFRNKNDFDINQHFINIWKESKKELMNIFIDDIKNKNIELRNKIKEYFQEIKIKDVNNFDDLYKQYKSDSKKN